VFCDQLYIHSPLYSSIKQKLHRLVIWACASYTINVEQNRKKYLKCTRRRRYVMHTQSVEIWFFRNFLKKLSTDWIVTEAVGGVFCCKGEGHKLYYWNVMILGWIQFWYQQWAINDYCCNSFHSLNVFRIKMQLWFRNFTSFTANTIANFDLFFQINLLTIHTFSIRKIISLFSIILMNRLQ
jgi:hypothetical protein